jgi:hypothetical protein
VVKVSKCSSTHNSLDFVIPSTARDLQFAAKCRSLAMLGMTILKSVTPDQAFIPGFSEQPLTSELRPEAAAGEKFSGGALAAGDGAVHRPVVSAPIRRFSGKKEGISNRRCQSARSFLITG